MKCKTCNREDRPPYRKGNCHNCYQRTWRKAHYIPGVTRDWIIAHPERVMWLAAKHRAKQQGVPFTIKTSDIVISDTCPILGIPLRFRGDNKDYSPSLDRVIPALGYIAGNIAVISNRANQIKSNATLEELKRLVSYVSSFKT